MKLTNPNITLARKFLEQGPATIDEVAKHLGCSYEYARRIVRLIKPQLVRVANLKSGSKWVAVAVYSLTS